jgi:hypothetical protein
MHSRRAIAATLATFGLVVATLGIIVAFGTITAPTARAQPAGNTAVCSDSSLKGNYLGTESGTSSSTGPVAVQAQATFNGDGTGTAIATIMTETSGPTTVTDTLTYTVNSHCLGTLTAVRSNGQTAHFNVAVVQKWNEFYLLQTDPGFVVTADFRAQ